MAPPRTNYGAPQLPRALLDQVDGSSSRPRKQNRAFNHTYAPATRKDKRKLEREQKRSSRQQAPKPAFKQQPSRPFQKQIPTREDISDEEDDEDQSSPPPQASTTKSDTKTSVKTSLKSILKRLPPDVEDEHQKTISSKKTPLSIQEETRSLSRREKEKLAHDDAEIAALEKRLGIKSKKLPKSFAEDGLDVLLGDLDGENGSDGLSNGKRRRAEDVEWLERKRRKVADEIQSGSEDEDDENSEDEDGVAGTGSELDFDDDLDVAASMESDNLDEENFDGIESGNQDDGQSQGDQSDSDNFDEFDSETVQAQPLKRVRENPYIAPGVGIDKQATKYIPPSLRGAPSGDAELAVRLRRQVQGLLNKLSEANLVSILGDIESLYQNNPRQYVTSTLIDLLLALICDPSPLNDTFIILHAGFIAAVYRVIGLDFGAQILERVVGKFDECYSAGIAPETTGKEMINLMSLLAQLYNFQVIGCELMFDYVRSFLDELSETHTELLLRVVRSAGSQLRQDDPSSLKDIVLLLQQTVAKGSEAKLSVRTKFMIETINDLKNNKLKAGAATSAMTSEHLTHMKRTLGTLNSRSVKASEPLRIGLGDIRNTEKRGKWWLVGASWKGNPGPSQNLTEEATTAPKSKSTTTDDEQLEHTTDPTTDLLALAKAARMNTDIRRAIFITIMSASDYKDAQLRLLKLKLKRSQEVEIPKVLLHCAGAEQMYNPYYTLIASKLCGEHRVKMSFQFALWDLFRKMGESWGDGTDEEKDVYGGEEEDERLGTTSVVNYAKLFGNLIASGRLGLNVLKNLDLIYLQPHTKTFLEILFITVFLQCQSSNPSLTTATDQEKRKRRHASTTGLGIPTVFAPALEFPGLKTGLQWFLRKVVAKTDLAREAERGTVKGGVRDAIGFLSGSGEVAA